MVAGKFGASILEVHAGHLSAAATAIVAESAGIGGASGEHKSANQAQGPGIALLGFLHTSHHIRHVMQQASRFTQSLKVPILTAPHLSQDIVEF